MQVITSTGPQASLQSENRSLGVLYIISLYIKKMYWATKGGGITAYLLALAKKRYIKHVQNFRAEVRLQETTQVKHVAYENCMQLVLA